MGGPLTHVGRAPATRAHAMPRPFTVGRRQLARALALVCVAACTRERGAGGEGDSGRQSLAAARDQATGDSATAVAILDSLKAIAPTGGVGFDTSFIPPIRPGDVLAMLSDSGLTLHDVNEADTTVHLTRRQVELQLARRRGRAFTSLAHLAHIYSQPYPQYSALEFARGPEGLEVVIGGWYRLTFARERGGLRLRRVSYLELEGE